MAEAALPLKISPAFALPLIDLPGNARLDTFERDWPLAATDANLGYLSL